jgi:toxin HigB-1
LVIVSRPLNSAVRQSIEIKRLNFSLALCNRVRYSVAMIKNFRDNWLRNFFVEDIQPKKIPADIRSRLFRKLQLLDDATSDADLRSPPSNHFEKLSGELEAKCSIRVNNQWRIIFIWDDERGEADGIYLDNHTYK